MTLYGGVLRLYPRPFRDEYGEDMELLLRHQLRDENAARVWGRTFVDLMITVPSLRMEAHMPVRTSLPVIYAAAAVASLVLAVLAGSAVGLVVVGIAGLLLFGGLAVVSWRRAQSLGSAGGASGSWWKFLGAGTACLVGVVVLVNGNGELPSGWWVAFMGALLTSLALMATGLVLGISHAASRRTS